MVDNIKTTERIRKKLGKFKYGVRQEVIYRAVFDFDLRSRLFVIYFSNDAKKFGSTLKRPGGVGQCYDSVDDIVTLRQLNE